MPPNVGEVRNALRAGSRRGAAAAVPLRRAPASTPRRERRALDRDPAVALDEGDDHVLAAQPGEQVGGRDAAERVGGLRRARTRRWSRRSVGALPYVLVDQRRHAGRGDGRAGHDLQAEHRARRPRPRDSTPAARSVVARCAPSTRVSRSTRQRQADDEHDGTTAGGDDDDDRAGWPDRVAEQAHRRAERTPVQRPGRTGVRGPREAQVEDLDDGEQPQHEADHERGDPARARRQAARAARRAAAPRAGCARTRPGVSCPSRPARPGRTRPAAPRRPSRRHRAHDATTTGAGCRASGSTAGRSSRTCVPVIAAPRARRRAGAPRDRATSSASGGRVGAVPPQPPDVAPERLGQQQPARTSAADVGERPRQQPGGDHRQRDALDRGDDLAPVARRHRPRAATAAPSRRRRTRSASRRSPAPTARPPARRTR